MFGADAGSLRLNDGEKWAPALWLGDDGTLAWLCNEGAHVSPYLAHAAAVLGEMDRIELKWLDNWRIGHISRGVLGFMSTFHSSKDTLTLR